MAQSHAATVAEIAELAPQVLQLTVAFDDDSFSFSPGQWVTFRFPEGVSRAYTIASPPEAPRVLELCVRLGAGKGGEALRRLEPGAEITLDGPFGDFQLPDDRDVVFLAGDTGIAPIRSIVLHLVATGDSRNAVVLYEPDHRHILYSRDFDPLARSGAIRHESGRIEALIERNRRHLASSVMMAAGFDPFLDRVRATLAALDISDAELITESFGPQP